MFSFIDCKISNALFISKRRREIVFYCFLGKNQCHHKPVGLQNPLIIADEQISSDNAFGGYLPRARYIAILLMFLHTNISNNDRNGHIDSLQGISSKAEDWRLCKALDFAAKVTGFNPPNAPTLVCKWALHSYTTASS